MSRHYLSRSPQPFSDIHNRYFGDRVRFICDGDSPEATLSLGVENHCPFVILIGVNGLDILIKILTIEFRHLVHRIFSRKGGNTNPSTTLRATYSGTADAY